MPCLDGRAANCTRTVVANPCLDAKEKRERKRLDRHGGERNRWRRRERERRGKQIDAERNVHKIEREGR